MEDRQVEKLRQSAVRGRQYENMMNTEGWKLFETELKKMLEAFKSQGVSKELMGKSVKHAAIVGGYNALQSLLDLTYGEVDKGKKADIRVEAVEEEIREREYQERQLRRV